MWWMLPSLEENPSERHSQEMFEELVGEVWQRLPNNAISEAEITRLSTYLKVSVNGRLDREEAYTNLLVEMKSLEEKLENEEIGFTANFHNTEAYSNLSALFASLQDVIVALRTEFHELCVATLEVKFSPRSWGDDKDELPAPSS
ncbi:hypothetical protein Adt_27211 [Abeliophyllum distichum]|uniref:Uncharacterized protein n=1 Tax=Abeliophyllum distichum TaxID=126358 RepID=A0ABD1RT45_9LAMI